MDIDAVDQMTIIEALHDAAILWEERADRMRDGSRPQTTRREMAADARRLLEILQQHDSLRVE